MAIEDILEMAINIDVIVTLRSSFNRGNYLQKIIMVQKSLPWLIILIEFFVAGAFLRKLNSDYSDNKKNQEIINLGLYQTLDLQLYTFILPLEILNIMIMFVCLLVVISSLVLKFRATVKDGTHRVLKRQLVYFALISAYEIPFKIFCVILTVINYRS